MNRTIAVFGSARRNGNTGKLIDIIAKKLTIEVIDLSLMNISPFDYEHKNLEDDFLPLMDHILKHENIIFVSPVYWFAMSAPMKIFVDRFSDFLSVEALKNKGRKLRGKFGYVASTSVSETIDRSFINSFSNTFEYLGMKNGGFIHVNCENGFDFTGCENDVANFVKKLNSC